MCEFDPSFDGGRVSRWRPDHQQPNPPDSSPETGESCHNCGSERKLCRNYVRNETKLLKKSHNVSVPCPFVRQADDVREFQRRSTKLPWIGWLMLVSIFMAPLLGSTNAKVCQSIDVRNTPEGLKNLSDCEVVEGHVQILLIENANISAYSNYSFPQLREITDYLLLYRAFNLTTLSGLFPNLTVIRGQNLFSNYALAIWEMHEMREVGLPSLTDIRRGSVRIEKNNNLCFADTIEWDRIAQDGENVIRGNKDPNSCGTCPSHCPASQNTKKPLCWNQKHCQKDVCKDENDKPCPGGICFINGANKSQCCHSSCVGGCDGPGNDHCFACKFFLDGDKCTNTAKCLAGTYEFRDLRCISLTECINEPKTKSPSCGKKEFFKPFGDKCLSDCPTGFEELTAVDSNGKDSYTTCTKCKGPCPKVCQGQSVTSLNTVQALKGCTTIAGALEISVNGANNMVKELEDNLNSIEVVDHYVKIVRSYPLKDLTFLRNLKKINGKELDHGSALSVRDNENLRELFGNMSKLEVVSGKLSFSFNPWLCYPKIIELSRTLNMSHPSESDVSTWTNGQKASCHNEILKVDVRSVSEYAVIFDIHNFRRNLTDQRHLIGYEYHYREAPLQDVTIVGGRDACGNDGWFTGEIKAESSENMTHQTHLVSHLKSFAQYAFYFNTYMVLDQPMYKDGNGSVSGATSEIMYILTRSGQPNSPVGLTVTANTSSEIHISWKEPTVPNANITFYYIQVQIIYDDGSQLNERNYCEKTLEAFTSTDKKPMAEERDNSPLDSKCCSCTDPGMIPTNLREEEGFQKDSIDFENNLHNTVYIKRGDGSSSCTNSGDEFPGQRRRRRSATRYSREANEEDVLATTTEEPTTLKQELSEFLPSQQSSFQPPVNTSTLFIGETGKLSSFETRINKTSYLVRFLRHFSNYRVTVRACRDDAEFMEGKKEGSGAEQCSFAQYETVRTKPIEHLDSIDNATVTVRFEHNGTSSDVIVEWEPPKNPNGLIVSYHIDLSRTAESRPHCKPAKVSNGDNSTRLSYREAGVQPGKWQVRLWATSLSGPDGYKVVREIEVPEQPHDFSFWLIVTFVLILVVMIIGLGLCRYHLKKNDLPKNIIASVNPDYPFFETNAYVPDEYEVARENIQVVRELGQGSFGMVYEGFLSGSIRGISVDEMRCAVKTVNEGATVRERIEFLNEASVMKAFHCHHVVKLLGVVSKGQPTYVIMELMVNGDLKSFLRSLRPDTENSDSGSSQRPQPPTLKCILKMAVEISDGMAYLSAKKYVHRDLAARNCMVADDLTVKIGDFGMTRDIYETDYYRKGGKGLLPVRWMSPESLKDGVFTSQSDIWSFGVVLWEMATLASQPYQGLSNEQVLKYVMEGGSMEMPEGCPDILYNLMLQCWKFHPRQRPRFVDVVDLLLPEIEGNFRDLSFYHSPDGQEFLQTERQDRPIIHEVSEEEDYGEDIPLRNIVPDDTVVELLDVDCPDDDDVMMSESHDEEEPLSPDRDSRDHAPLTYPGQNRRPYIDPAQNRNGNSHLPSHESSKTTSDSSKSGSHQSNGSVTNGFVNRRRDAPAEC